MTFQPLSGPGWRVLKRAGTVEEVRAEILRRLAAMPGTRGFKLPAIIPADRGRNMANWQIESRVGMPSEIEEVISGVMREMEVEEPHQG